MNSKCESRAPCVEKAGTENRELRSQVDTKFGLENVIGQSPAMEGIFEIVLQVAPARASVLVLGESGTVLSSIAKAIHNLSPRRSRWLPCIARPSRPRCWRVNCLVTKKARSPGARTPHRPLRTANGGTLFLDEIGEIDQAIHQAAGFLGRTFERVGSNKTLRRPHQLPPPIAILNTRYRLPLICSFACVWLS